ncbi:hypothetical protein TWF696_009420 [Orbilia brochopaga]|uniref:GH15-like domain-containing protein n=1 Tax=Orbilia brochopaga TaxID=3140254 RepID=A0AAV9UBB8_9PEZI
MVIFTFKAMVYPRSSFASLLGVLYALFAVSNAAAIIRKSTIDSWISEHYYSAETALKRNIGSSSNALIPKGVVIASPSTSGPDYYFQWIRDASCVMEHLVDNYLDSGEDLTYIMDWIDVQKENPSFALMAPPTMIHGDVPSVMGLRFGV